MSFGELRIPGLPGLCCVSSADGWVSSFWLTGFWRWWVLLLVGVGLGGWSAGWGLG